MKYINLFDYPNKLQIIFDKLDNYGIRAIIIGGYTRDKFLNLDSKDLDIELYGVSSYEDLEKILKKFGTINNVGKSFGVCKLSLGELQLDFTLPRKDNKIAPGHCGFKTILDKNLDFKTAASRRDFTINAIGFDTIEKKILDPFNGQADIKTKTLRAVNIKTFAEDPLRVLRAVGFAARFNFNIENKLFILCKKMCDENILGELAQERIYIEIEKILLKSAKPSLGFLLLKKLNALKYFSPLHSLCKNDFYNTLNALDIFTRYKLHDNKTNMILMLSILCYKFTLLDVRAFITNLTNDKRLLKKVLEILENDFKNSYTDSQLLRLATKVNIEYYLLFSKAIHNHIDEIVFEKLKIRASKLNILHKKAIPYLQGRDILKLGIKPSKEYSKILHAAYEVQMDLKINSKNEAIVWLQQYIKNL